MKPFLLSSIFGPDDPFPEVGAMKPLLRDALILVATLSVIAVTALIWAVYVRKRKRRHKHHHHHHNPNRYGQIQTDDASAAADGSQMFHKRKGRRRREHRPRNPTLAETGGLPPARGEGPPGPARTQTQ
jgi:type VI protein secretion system component VasK